MGDVSETRNVFKYFSYGSNLLEKRIHINNPTAKRFDSGLLEDYRLDFNYFSPRWKGHAATIVPDPGNSVWGAIWEVDEVNLPDLDRQEGVSTGIYKVIEVDVKASDSNIYKCRSYMLCQQPPNSNIVERPPSKVYLDTILQGARESKLPEDYIKRLEMIPHNDYTGPVDHQVELKS